VFPEYMLKPELQDLAVYADGIDNIVETQRRVARNYLDDGSIEKAIPPLKALLYVMATGSYEGLGHEDPEFRKLFARESMLTSDWYKARLDAKQKVDISLWEKHAQYIDTVMEKPLNAGISYQIDEDGMRRRIARRLETFRSADYREKLNGCIGVDPELVED